MLRKMIYPPKGKAYIPYMDALTQPHLLIAGTTGSGKSVLVNGLIYTALYDIPSKKSFILLDPKRVELSMYKGLQHTIAYASEPTDMIKALEKAMDITEARYKIMQKKGLRKTEEGDLYVIIDEYADIVTTNRKQVEPLIQRLAQIGRAANVHLWLCTQSPLASIINTNIKVNFDSRFGLHTRSAQDSRNILGFTGCEMLPRYGQAIYMTPCGSTRISIPYYSDDELIERVKHWTNQKDFFGRLLTA